MGQTRHPSTRACRSAHTFGLDLRSDLSGARQGSGPRPALVQPPRHEPASRRDLAGRSAGRSRYPHRRSGSVAYQPETRYPRQHHHPAAPATLARTQSGGKRLAVHAQYLAVEPDLPHLRRHRRYLLPRLEPARRPALAHHVPRATTMGTWVLTNRSWY
ncbi:hypothetical protein GDI2901 [Gluconacetobacter diazotrophicus PA1 5]|uniref:Uncharacterized protein n=1 Tax=Gluconacetobacter diazotrophicus (strain ATCC 49037 / DSM 5601 / CCUG 37298 / CIP 103539 / LMG 7603 / PAl5) TaxID=272568 RepID=A9HR60_GLUDA|nr:hypothetical protein GDI2901 [Gluconacetobacter diazotrophicus PA1 5]